MTTFEDDETAKAHALILALAQATRLMAEDKRTRRDDYRWAVFSQCMAALAPYMTDILAKPEYKILREADYLPQSRAN